MLNFGNDLGTSYPINSNISAQAERTGTSAVSASSSSTNLIDAYLRNNQPNNHTNNNSNLQNLGPENLIVRYLSNLGITNSVGLQQYKEIVTPSGIGNFNNYQLLDKYGNETTKIQYSKEGDAVVQNVKVKSVDGTTVDRTVKNSDGVKSLNMVIKNKNGDVLMTREKTTQKIDDDKVKTVVNGEVYNVSGLKSNVITVEHNGETTVIDLDKMIKDDVIAEKGDESDVVRDTKITDEEKAKLISKIKSLDGDDLFRLPKSTENIKYFADMDSFYNSDTKSLELQINDIFGLDVYRHEIGHGFNHNNGEVESGKLVSDNQTLANIRNLATNNYLNNKTGSDNDNRFFGKFLDKQKYVEIYGDEEKAISVMQDEIFAESYNLLNTTEIVGYADGGGGVQGRVLSMMKYVPQALVEVNKLI